MSQRLTFVGEWDTEIPVRFTNAQPREVQKQHFLCSFVHLSRLWLTGPFSA